MMLFHYTSGNALRAIHKHGLTVGDVPTDIERNRGRIGVWFTSSSNPNGHGLDGSGVDKKRFRLQVDSNTLEPDRLCSWLDWAASNVTSRTLEALHKTATIPESWFVYFGWVKPELIAAVMDTSSGTCVENWDTAWPAGDELPGVPYWARERWQKKMLKSVRRALQKPSAAFSPTT